VERPVLQDNKTPAARGSVLQGVGLAATSHVSNLALQRLLFLHCLSVWHELLKQVPQPEHPSAPPNISLHLPRTHLPATASAAAAAAAAAVVLSDRSQRQLNFLKHFPVLAPMQTDFSVRCEVAALSRPCGDFQLEWIRARHIAGRHVDQRLLLVSPT